MKFILWLLVVGLVLAWLMRPKKRAAAPPAPSRMPWRRAADLEAAEPMVCCQACGTYVPASEALGSPQASYCSEEHRHQHQADR